jgi:hypothetical protein
MGAVDEEVREQANRLEEVFTEQCRRDEGQLEQLKA